MGFRILRTGFRIPGPHFERPLTQIRLLQAFQTGHIAKTGLQAARQAPHAAQTDSQAAQTSPPGCPNRRPGCPDQLPKLPRQVSRPSRQAPRPPRKALQAAPAAGTASKTASVDTTLLSRQHLSLVDRDNIQDCFCRHNMAPVDKTLTVSTKHCYCRHCFRRQHTVGAGSRTAPVNKTVQLPRRGKRSPLTEHGFHVGNVFKLPGKTRSMQNFGCMPIGAKSKW